MSYDTIVVGAGLTGLAAARELRRHGKKVLVVEKGSYIGGRASSEKYEGCILDRGFQVILPAYPQLKKLHLNLPFKLFARGAWIWAEGNPKVFIDPLHHLPTFIKELKNRFGTVHDSLCLLRFLFANFHGTTYENLERLPFSPDFRRHFLETFLKGIFLDQDLTAPVALSSFYLKTLYFGGAALLPSGISGLAESLSTGTSIALETNVTTIEGGEIHCSSGERYSAKSFIVTAPELQPVSCDWFDTTCFYFLCSQSIRLEKMLVLCPNQNSGELNHFCNLSEIAEGYSPKGTSLISASTLGESRASAAQIKDAIVNRLKINPSTLQFVKSFHIRKALPRRALVQQPINHNSETAKIIFSSDMYSNGSQNEALKQGVIAAKKALHLMET